MLFLSYPELLMKQKMFTNPVFLYPRWKEKNKNRNKKNPPSKKLSLSFTVQVKLKKETALDKVYNDYFVP